MANLLTPFQGAYNYFSGVTPNVAPQAIAPPVAQAYGNDTFTTSLNGLYAQVLQLQTSVVNLGPQAVGNASAQAAIATLASTVSQYQAALANGGYNTANSPYTNEINDMATRLQQMQALVAGQVQTASVYAPPQYGYTQPQTSYTYAPTQPQYSYAPQTPYQTPVPPNTYQVPVQPNGYPVPGQTPPYGYAQPTPGAQLNCPPGQFNGQPGFNGPQGRPFRHERERERGMRMGPMQGAAPGFAQGATPGYGANYGQGAQGYGRRY